MSSDVKKILVDHEQLQAFSSIFKTILARKLNELSRKSTMTPNVRRFNPIAYICCLAVILFVQNAIKIQNVNAEQNIIGGNGGNNQLVQHSSYNQNALFKDLSGPTSGKIQTLDVICGKNFMTVRAEFSGPFYGIVFSKGTYGQENCIYVKPNSGLTHAAFNVYYDQCGTKPDLQGKFYENTIVIQYGSDIIEAYDEAKRLRCEWFEAYEKPATFKPAIPVADLEVVEMNFQGDDIDCWMEIQEGSGPMSREVSKIVPVGQPMTIVVAINDYNGQFDMRVKSCVAHDGAQQPIALTDEYGCVLRPKMLTPFIKIKNPGANKKATVLSYSRFLAFKFPDSMTVQIQCTVEVCRHGCADACQRVPSIAATTMQPELSLTAKWPSSPNQPAIDGPRPAKRNEPQAELTNESGQYKPARMQFNRQPLDDNYRPQFYAPQTQSQPQLQSQSQPQLQSPQSNPAPSHREISEDMSGSDSNHQPLVAYSQQKFGQSHRRSQEPSSLLDGRIPEYLVPNTNRRISFNNRPSISTTLATTTTTSSTSTTTTTTSTTSKPPAISQAPPQENSGLDESSVELTVGEDALTRYNPVSEQTLAAKGESDSDSSAEQQDNKSEASQPKPTVVLVQDEQQQQPAQQSANSRPAISSADQVVSSIEAPENKPSVQGGDENQESNKPENEQTVVAQESGASVSGQSSSSSSLKTVEVEIPANEDPVRSLMSSSSSNSPSQVNSFNSVRLSNIDSSVNGGYNSLFESNQDIGNRQIQTNYMHGSSNFSPHQEQIIQPRETQTIERRDKSENINIEGMMANSKSRFGARSQPQSSVQVAPPAEPSRLYNHQMPAADHQDIPIKESSESVNPDRVLIDRSDDSSSLTDLNLSPSLSLSSLSSSSSPSNNDESSNKSEAYSQETPIKVEESPRELATIVDSGTNSGKVNQPVVGTEELASGPIQIEDRIGLPASESLEEALTRLQKQIPQTAALVSSNDSQGTEQKSPLVAGDSKPDQRTDDQQSVVPKLDKPYEANDRLEINIMRSQRDKMQADSAKVQQNQKLVLLNGTQRELNQPFPNVVGQAKVISDPNNSLNSRASMLAQASNVEGVTSVMPAIQAQPTSQNQQASISKQPEPHQQQQQQSKPIAQITNVPINIGFSQTQIPAMHQLSQQLAYFQQQQHQQQQSKQTTVKPARSRFNILSPQAALHAVASRFLPKTAALQSQPQQQQQTQPQPQQLPASQQLPQLLNSFKLSPEQQQKLLSSAPMQQQAQKFFLAKQAQQFQQQQYLPNQRFASSQHPQPQPQQQTPVGAGIFGRSNNVHQPQQLVRSRRSAIMPRGKRGNGEVGITKTFMVVTGLDLAFLPNSTETELPPILEGRRLIEDDVIYGVCMPVVSLTFVLTCVFWFIVFLFSFCIYMVIKFKRNQDITNGKQEISFVSPKH